MTPVSESLKAYIAAATAAITAVLASDEALPVWLIIVLGAVVAGLATFMVPNAAARKSKH